MGQKLVQVDGEIGAAVITGCSGRRGVKAMIFGGRPLYDSTTDEQRATLEASKQGRRTSEGGKEKDMQEHVPAPHPQRPGKKPKYQHPPRRRKLKGQGD